MSVTPGEPSVQTPALEFKVASFALHTIELLNSDMDAVAAQLADTINQEPDSFHNAPVVIDLNHLTDTKTAIDFPLLVGIMRGYRMVPVAVSGGNAAQNEMAEMMDLAILGEQRKQSSASSPTQPRDVTPQAFKDRLEPRAVNRLIAHPVRSGQRFYARDGDLIVMGSVNSGAEVLADGNIHIYGFLRGRAHAGVKGNTETRIFCQHLQAELISIAGRYRVSVTLNTEPSDKPIAVYLKDNNLLMRMI